MFMKNSYRIKDDEVYITIKDKDKIMETVIDLCDFEIVSQYNWFAWYSKGNDQYYVRGFNYSKYGNKQFYMHRIIMNPPKDKLIDHINHDSLNNKRSNLRIVTPSQNHQNRKPGVQLGQSKERNVVWDKFTNSWKVYFKYNKQRYNVGRYKTIEEAIKARDEFKNKLGI